MSSEGILQLVAYGLVILACVRPLGAFMARVYAGEPTFLSRLLGPLESFLYRASGVQPTQEMGWRAYAVAMLLFNVAGLVAVYAIQRFQDWLPLNPAGLGPVRADLAFNTAVSFATNTNWQSYGGETTMSYFTQMAALTVQNFVSAASGMATLIALARGFSRRTSSTIGNFWVDLTRSTLYILLPLAIVLTLVLAFEGVPQTFRDYRTVDLLEPGAQQVLPLGPVASQIAIKQLGTNGGGFYNVNSAHPFENPTPLTNFLELLSILLISAALCYTFGVYIKDVHQGWALLAAMFVLFIPLVWLCAWSETSNNAALADLPVDAHLSASQPGGNMEGKETRFGISASTLWACATTAASNGSVNSMHASYTPLGSLCPMWLMQTGEVVFGGVGSGLYGMLMFAIVAVFVGGLMVGRTPEYLGKKVEPFEMKMASLVVLIPPFLVLAGTAIACVVDAGRSSVFNPGVRGFMEILYNFSSAGNNNGSAFAGMNANTPFYNIAFAVAMFLSRYALAIPVLAIAGSLARKKLVPPGAGTLVTHRPLFIGFLVSVVLLVGVLTFVPALALGPVVEHLMLAK